MVFDGIRRGDERKDRGVIIRIMGAAASSHGVSNEMGLHLIILAIN